MQLFDTHAHLDDEQFDEIRDAVIERSREAGIDKILSIGTTASSSKQTVELSNRYDGVYAAVGIQPNYCHEVEPDDWDRILALVDESRVVALGETGLDRYWDHAPFELQRDYFDRHLRLSQHRNLPFVVHMRDCESDILDMLREARARGPLRGVMHSYTGSAEGAAECVELGLHISFAGMVTYKKSEELRRIAATIPWDRLLIETDAPYLSPTPVRGQRPNEPAFVVHTAFCLAVVRGKTAGEIAARTTQNALQLFMGCQ